MITDHRLLSCKDDEIEEIHSYIEDIDDMNKLCLSLSIGFEHVDEMVDRDILEYIKDMK